MVDEQPTAASVGLTEIAVIAGRKAARAHETRRTWPRGYVVAPIVDEEFGLKDDVRAALERFRDERPFSLTGKRFVGAVSTVVRLLASAYNLPEPQVWHGGGWTGAATESEYVQGQHAIILHGKASVLAALHTFMHSRGYGEHAAVWWSLNTFRLIWPTSFARIETHTTTADGLARFLCAPCVTIHEMRALDAERRKNDAAPGRYGNTRQVMRDLTPRDPRLSDAFDPFGDVARVAPAAADRPVERARKLDVD